MVTFVETILCRQQRRHGTADILSAQRRRGISAPAPIYPPTDNSDADLEALERQMGVRPPPPEAGQHGGNKSGHRSKISLGPIDWQRTYCVSGYSTTGKAGDTLPGKIATPPS